MPLWSSSLSPDSMEYEFESTETVSPIEFGIHDNVLLNSTDGAPGTDENDYIILEPDPFDAILLESGTESGEGGDDMGFITTESGESVVLEDSSQDNPTGYGGRIQYEKGSQDADGVLKIRVNGQDKYIQLYNSPGSAVY